MKQVNRAVANFTTLLGVLAAQRSFAALRRNTKTTNLEVVDDITCLLKRLQGNVDLKSWIYGALILF